MSENTEENEDSFTVIVEKFSNLLRKSDFQAQPNLTQLRHYLALLKDRPELGWAPSDLAAYPRPSVAADVAVLSVIEYQGHPALVALAHLRGIGHEAGKWALPGRMLREHETLEKTAHDAVNLKIGIGDLELDQIKVFDEPDRDPRGWVLSVAHMATVPARVAQRALDNPNVGAIFISGDHYEFPDDQDDLPYEQRQILREAVKELRRRYSLLPDPGRILDHEFTLSQLREVHEAIQDTEIAPDTFRREMLPNLKATGHRAEGSVGKPPMMYQRKERFESKVRTSRFLAARMIDVDNFL
ncbi:MAG: NUDIX hydrolase [Actinobacteria bacterium]|nr:NUDIX hydrolase [Actinomycetota bacterium]NBY15668.1 NUDIX hydrolase [Actinomycetota bacterium]